MSNIIDPMNPNMDPNNFVQNNLNGNLNGNMNANMSANFDSNGAFNNNTLAGDNTKNSNTALNGVSTLLAEDDKWVKKKIQQTTQNKCSIPGKVYGCFGVGGVGKVIDQSDALELKSSLLEVVKIAAQTDKWVA